MFSQAIETVAGHKKQCAVDELESLLHNRMDSVILDLAAGTGIIGQYVSQAFISFNKLIACFFKGRCFKFVMTSPPGSQAKVGSALLAL